LRRCQQRAAQWYHFASAILYPEQRAATFTCRIAASTLAGFHPARAAVRRPPAVGRFLAEPRLSCAKQMPAFCYLSEVAAFGEAQPRRPAHSSWARSDASPYHASSARIRRQPRLGQASPVFQNASEWFMCREVRDLMRREVIKHERRRHDEAPGEIQLP